MKADEAPDSGQQRSIAVDLDARVLSMKEWSQVRGALMENKQIWHTSLSGPNQESIRLVQLPTSVFDYVE